jgi:hypothetical protein
MHHGIYSSLSSQYGLSGYDATEMYTLIEGLGGDIEQLWYEFKSVNLRSDLETGSEFDTEQLMKALDQVLLQSGDGWFVLCHLMLDVLIPTTTNVVLLKTMLEQGLSPDMETLYARYGYHYTRPILFEAICKAALKTRSGNTEDAGCIVTQLIQHGADIHYIYPQSLDRASRWNDIITLWHSADGRDFERGWFDALQDAGVDVDQYCWEDMRRTKQAIRLHGATRSGVDEQVLELPSISGLRCRPCHRTFCREHNRGILADFERSERGKPQRKAL